MTGVMVRIKRGENVENVEIEQLTESELMAVLSEMSRTNMAELISLFCKIVQRVEPMFLALERDGIIQRASEPQNPETEEKTDE